MFRLTALLHLVLSAAALLAQSVNSTTIKEERYSLSTLSKYCDQIEIFSKSQQARVFAQVTAGFEAPSGWVEFSSGAAWARAGKPQPLALVWYKDERVSRVAITSGDGENSYADYCYRPDGNLARLRSQPEVQNDCDNRFLACKVTVRAEQLYPPYGELAQLSIKQATKRPPFIRNLDHLSLNALVSRPALRPERSSGSFASTNSPEYLTIWDLPFNRLLYASGAMK